MLRSGTNSFYFFLFFFFLLFFFFSSMRYSILPAAVWSSAVYTCSHTSFVDRFMMSEGGDPLSLPLTSKTGQSHSVAQNRQTSFFFFFFFFFFTLLASSACLTIDIRSTFTFSLYKPLPFTCIFFLTILLFS